MRIVHLNYDDGITGGATIAARRIFQAGGLGGHDVVFVCREQTASPGTFHSVRHPDKGFKRASLLAKRKLVYASLYPFCREFRSLNCLRSGIAEFVNSLDPDIVHLHWVKVETISIEEVGSIRAPVVWSLHDLWPCLGVQAYPSETPLRGTAALLDGWVRRRKARVFRRAGMFPVGPSKWCAEQARNSGIFENAVIGVIPNPLDTELLAPRPKQEARVRLGASPDSFVIAFGANHGTRMPIKGFDRLAQAIAHLDAPIRQRIEVVVFGEDGYPQDLHGARLRFVGRISDQEPLTWLYSAADVFAMPSRQETFGQTKSESLSCGTPVVAFGQTACGEGITHRVTGWVARADDVADYAEGLRWAYELATSPSRQAAARVAARESAVAQFSMRAVSEQWSSWYRFARGDAATPLGTTLLPEEDP